MDIATIIGFLGAAIATVVSILLGGSLGAFVDIPSIFMTLGGGFSATIMCYSMPTFLTGMKAAGIAFKGSKIDEASMIKKIIELSNIARKDGLLALEEASNSLEDPFMKKGIMLIVDGTDPELVRSIMETELNFIESRHKTAKEVWEKLAEMGPAWGMIGTLVGLVLMLQNLSDPSTIGPSMAVALLTTFYGSLLANWVANPIAVKLGQISGAEILVKEILIEGLLSIQAGENPRVIEEKLKAFLAPVLRLALTEPAAEAGEK